MAEADNESPIHFDFGYNMQHHPRGLAIIFNNERFEKMANRTGTRIDRDKLYTTFKNLGFEVHVFDDYTANRISDVLLKAGRFDHSDFDCFLCVFLTHGDEGIIYGSDGDPDSFKSDGNVNSTSRTWLLLNDDVFDIFRGSNCRSLIGKPKIFIIQACRGGKAELPSQGVPLGAPAKDFETSAGVRVTIPTEADFLISYSSSEGYFSIRELYKGTWFIQDLTSVLNQFGKKEDFVQMLTVVNKLVSERTFEVPGNPEPEERKQMPCFLSKLTRQLRLTDQRSGYFSNCQIM